MSYTIDVYKEKLNPTQDFFAFAAFVSFFPQLVAGPIERATHLLPQFQQQREFSYKSSVDGLQQILWGFIKKVVIADNCAESVNFIFDNFESLNGSTLLLGAILFSFQIYGDFSGYSDMAIGIAKLFGIQLNQNFAFPYFSRDIAEFWRRWHISLSTWFRDYVYIPLGGNQNGSFKTVQNILVVFLLSGLWHGANWTFVAWGLFHALCFLPLILGFRHRKYIDIVAKDKTVPSLVELAQIGSTFFIVMIGWIFFRSTSLSHAYAYIRQLFSPSLLSIPVYNGRSEALWALIYVGVFLVIEWVGRKGAYGIEWVGEVGFRPVRYLIYYTLLFAIIILGAKSQTFIYFQF